MEKKTLTVKHMKETLVNYSANQKDFDRVYGTFYEMAFMGFISDSAWKKFNDEVKGWHVIDKDSRLEVRDAANGDALVHDMNSGRYYFA